MGEISEKFVMATMVGLGVRVHATLPEAYGGPYFNEIDLRTMFGHARSWHRDVVEGRWVIETRHQGCPWKVIRVVPVDNFLIYKNIIRLDRPN